MKTVVIAANMRDGYRHADPFSDLIITPNALHRIQGERIERVQLTERALQLPKDQRRLIATALVPAAATAADVLDILWVLSQWIEAAPDDEQPTCAGCTAGRSCYGCAMAGLAL